MDPAELLLSLPEWVFNPETWAWVAGAVILFILGWSVLRSGATAEDVHDETDSTYGQYEDPAPRMTRREGLDYVLAGRWEWEDYLAYFRGWPDDGSLKKEQKQIAVALEKATSPKLKLTYADNEGYTDFTPDLHATFKAHYNAVMASKESTVLRRERGYENMEAVPGKYCRCSKAAHEGMRVHRDRVHHMPNSTVLNVWQPRSKQFVEIWGWNFMQHPCCPDYLWFVEVNGKKIA